MQELPRPWAWGRLLGASVWSFSKWACLSHEPDLTLHKNKPGVRAKGCPDSSARLRGTESEQPDGKAEAELQAGLSMLLSFSASPVFCNAVALLLKQIEFS